LATGSALVFDGTNLGVGVTPSAWDTITGLQDKNASLGGFNNNMYLMSNVYYDGSAYRYLATAAAAQYAHVGGDHRFLSASSGTAGNVATLTQTMILTPEGNLGLGVTPSAWDSTYKAIQVGARSMFYGIGSEANMANNAYYNAGYKYVATSAAGLYTIDANVHKWYSAPSGTAGNAITFTQAMTLDASGQLAIGNTSPAAKLEVYQVGLGASVLPFYAHRSNAGIVARFVNEGFGSSLDITATASNNILLQAASGDALSFSANGNATSDMVIDTSGNLLVGGTAARGTTVGTKHLDLFNGTAPAGTLTDGVSLYSASGDLKFMNAAGDAFDVGYRNIPQNSQSAAYTLVLADAGKHIFHPVGDNNARTFTIPANSSVAYPVGTAITFINMAVANVTIAITTDTLTLSPAGTTGSRTLATNGSATCIKITSTSWLISGSGLT
jgi:hypothetical protein